MKLDANVLFALKSSKNKNSRTSDKTESFKIKEGEIEMSRFARKDNTFGSNLYRRGSFKKIFKEKEEIIKKVETVPVKVLRGSDENKDNNSAKNSKKCVVLNEKEVKRLWFSAIKAQNLKMISDLLAQDYEMLCFKDQNGYTALHYAIETCNNQMFEVLISTIKEVAQQKNNGKQPKQQQKQPLQHTQQIQITNHQYLQQQTPSNQQQNIQHVEKTRYNSQSELQQEYTQHPQQKPYNQPQQFLQQPHQQTQQFQQHQKQPLYVQQIEDQFQQLKLQQQQQQQKVFVEQQINWSQAQKNEWILNQQQAREQQQREQLQKQLKRQKLQHFQHQFQNVNETPSYPENSVVASTCLECQKQSTNQPQQLQQCQQPQQLQQHINYIQKPHSYPQLNQQNTEIQNSQLFNSLPYFPSSAQNSNMSSASTNSLDHNTYNLQQNVYQQTPQNQIIQQLPHQLQNHCNLYQQQLTQHQHGFSENMHLTNKIEVDNYNCQKKQCCQQQHQQQQQPQNKQHQQQYSPQHYIPDHQQHHHQQQQQHQRQQQHQQHQQQQHQQHYVVISAHDINPQRQHLSSSASSLPLPQPSLPPPPPQPSSSPQQSSSPQTSSSSQPSSSSSSSPSLSTAIW